MHYFYKLLVQRDFDILTNVPFRMPNKKEHFHDKTRNIRFKECLKNLLFFNYFESIIWRWVDENVIDLDKGKICQNIVKS